MKKKILFLLKLRQLPDQNNPDNCLPYGYGYSSGLINSASFINNMLKKQGFVSNIVEVVDNNCIDREVTKYKPDIVVIEALWVIPEKFKVLNKLHPKVQWIVRCHSEMPFLANEGMALEWFSEYLKYPNVSISCNSPSANDEFKLIISEIYPKMTSCELNKRVVYLPNYYPVKGIDRPKKYRGRRILDVGCFGAIRPMKNQLEQAIGAIKYAEQTKRHLRFHINVGRIEQKGDSVLKNLRNLFKNMKDHKLVEHYWCNHKDFVEIVESMDIGLQVSFSETFNIVTADFVNHNVPVVVSEQIGWIKRLFRASPTSSDDIAKKMSIAIFINNYLPFFNNNKRNLRRYVNESQRIWISWVKSL